MKKIIIFILALTLTAVMFASCDGEDHTHSFAEEWSANDNYHWHACTAVDGCSETEGKADHDYEARENEDGEPVYVCKTCNHSVDEVPSHVHDFDGEWQKDANAHWQTCISSDCDEIGNKGDHDLDTALDKDGNLIDACKVCGYATEKVNTSPEHAHTYGANYSYNDTYHWRECTTEGCFEAEKSDEHQYGNPEATYGEQTLTLTYTCVDCSYVKTETKTVESSVDDAVEWDNIFKNFNLTNFSMYVYFGDKANPAQTNHCIVTEDGVYYCIPGEGGREFYVVKNDDGSYSGYMRSGNDFVIMPDEVCEPYFTNATRETVIRVTFAENFDKFEYNAETSTYYAEEELEAICYDFSGEEMATLYCYNNEVKIADGKIISIACDYRFNNDNDHYSFIYYNIGMSEVKIPQSIIDNAKEYVDEDNSNIGGNAGGSNGAGNSNVGGDSANGDMDGGN